MSIRRVRRRYDVRINIQDVVKMISEKVNCLLKIAMMKPPRIKQIVHHKKISAALVGVFFN